MTATKALYEYGRLKNGGLLGKVAQYRVPHVAAVR